MRAHEIITESAFVTQQQVDLIMKDCQPFLQASDGKLVFRGQHSDQFINLVRKNRTPKDTPKDVHKMIDDFMRSHFGIGFRSEAMFCTASLATTLQYGTPRVVFPIGNFDYCWSPSVSDMYEDLLPDMLCHYDADSYLDSEEIKRGLDKASYRCNVSMVDFRNAIESRNEIMINCNEYYAIPFGSDTISLLKSALTKAGYTQ